MRAGELRHSITIEVATETQNAFGEPVQAWATWAEVWASREDLTGREYFASQQVNAEVTTRFRIRHIDGVISGMRINSDGILYDIQSVQDPDGKSRELLLLTKRGGNAPPINGATVPLKKGGTQTFVEIP